MRLNIVECPQFVPKLYLRLLIPLGMKFTGLHVQSVVVPSQLHPCPLAPSLLCLQTCTLFNDPVQGLVPTIPSDQLFSQIITSDPHFIGLPLREASSSYSQVFFLPEHLLLYIFHLALFSPKVMLSFSF